MADTDHQAVKRSFEDAVRRAIERMGIERFHECSIFMSSRKKDGLILFLTDGRIEMDNNTVERTIRPITLNRKNALFAGHEQGAQNWAILASLIETCKLNEIEPYAYLTEALTAIVNGHKQSQIEERLPWK